MTLDPRRHPFNANVAAAYLQGQVDSARFVDGTDYRICAALTDMKSAPDAHGRTSQALFGEVVTVYDEHEGWAFGQLQTDGYVGWVPNADLQRHDGSAPTHRIIAPLTRSTENSIKIIGHGPFPMGGLLRADADIHAVNGSSAPFRQTDAGAIPDAHIGEIGMPVSDWVAVAETFLGSPYVWGGRSPMGLDCSALVQLALQQGGVTAPRDSDMQEAELGTQIERAANLQRGDLVFWPGHVGVMVSPEDLLHANAFAMATTIEPVSAVEARIGAARTIRRVR